MSRTIELASNAAASSWTDLTSKVVWAGMKLGGSAHQLENGAGAGFNLDDDAGDVDIPARRAFRVVEDATSPDTVLMKGRISDKNLARGTRFDGDAKAFDTTVDDNNMQLRGIPVDGWSRPAETGRARIQALAAAFLNGSPRASTVIDCTTYAPNTHTVTMPAKRYDATDVAGVALDCAAAEGKQVFVTEDDELFYDLDTSTTYAASLSITDDDPDPDAAEFAPIEPTGEQQGNEFYSGGTLHYGTASVSDARTTRESDHDYWRTAYYDGTAGDATTAASLLATMLDNQSREEETFRCSIVLLDSQVDLIKRGQTVSFRSAAAGVVTPRTLRVASLYWEPVGVSGTGVETYLAHLQLGVPSKLVRRVRPGPVVHPPFTCVPTDFTVPWDAGGVGSAIISDATWAGTQAADSTDSGGIGGTCTLYAGATYAYHPMFTYHNPVDVPSGTLGSGWLNQVGVKRQSGFPGGFSLDMGANGELGPSPPPPEVIADGTFTIPDTASDFVAFLVAVNDINHNSYSSSMTVHLFYVSGPDPRFEDLGPCTNGVPAPGQPVRDIASTGDGTTTSYATQFPYRAGSLVVFVNGLDWTAEVTETDPTTGDYDLAYPPPLGSTVWVRYTAAP